MQNKQLEVVGDWCTGIDIGDYFEAKGFLKDDDKWYEESDGKFTEINVDEYHEFAVWLMETFLVVTQQLKERRRWENG